MLIADALIDMFLAALSAGAVMTVLLLGKSIKDFTQTGPQLRDEVMRLYFGYTLRALVRLGLWAWVTTSLLGLVGGYMSLCLSVALELPYTFAWALTASITAVIIATIFQFLHMLHQSPGVLVASSNYDLTRLYGLWERLRPEWLHATRIAAVLAVTGLAALAVVQVALAGEWTAVTALLVFPAAAVALYVALVRDAEPAPVEGAAGSEQRPNIVMIGSDTLRPDRISGFGYARPTTPRIDTLLNEGAVGFRRCYVPLARTAPSLVSLFTASWPHNHGVRSNYVGDEQKTLGLRTLPAMLAEHGYRTITISDWCGSDLGKFDLGFQQRDVPEDQWNLKYLIRQGPKDVRLFLSLFLHNRIGRSWLPELYYLAGVPLGSDLGRQARRRIAEAAGSQAPFLLNVFTSHTHPPFASEYPYYTLFSDEGYRGESKFAMRRLTDPFEVIRSQTEPKKAFDLDQINALYDGAVRAFDDEVGRIVDFLSGCGLSGRTILVLYSDHGMDLFEHNTWGQGNSVVGDSNRTPLLVSDPRQPASGVSDIVLRSIDVAPTLLDLAGITVPPQWDGRSFAGNIRGEAGAPSEPAFAETGLWLTRIPGVHPDHLDYPSILDLLHVPDSRTGTLAIRPSYQRQVDLARDRMIVTDGWKLVYVPLRDGVRYHLYDLDSDPLCQRDVAERHPDVVAQLRAVLDHWIAQGVPSDNEASVQSAADARWQGALRRG